MRWFAQGMFYVGLHHVLRMMEAAEPALSDAARAINIRRDLVRWKRRSALPGLFVCMAAPTVKKGGAPVEHFEQATAVLIERIETRRGLVG
jgi:hypothetical protein